MKLSVANAAAYLQCNQDQDQELQLDCNLASIYEQRFGNVKGRCSNGSSQLLRLDCCRGGEGSCGSCAKLR